jgi:hypothetical protein
MTKFLEKARTPLMIGLMIGVIAQADIARADVLAAANVANLTTANLRTIPAGRVFNVTSMIVANGNEQNTSSCCSRLGRSGAFISGFIAVSGGDTVQINFDPPVRYTAGQIIQVRNGASSGVLHYTVTGEFVN